MSEKDNKDLDAIFNEIVSTARITISKEENEELNRLKESDADKWHRMVIEKEKQSDFAMQKLRNDFITATKEKIAKDLRLNRVEEEVANFKKDNPDSVTDINELIDIVPPKLTRGFKNGTISTADFLKSSQRYTERYEVKKEKVEEDMPNLNNVGGKTTVENDNKIPPKVIRDIIV